MLQGGGAVELDRQWSKTLRGHSKISVPAVIAGRGSGGTQQSINLLDDALKFIFSWIVLMPIAIIISGRYLGQLFKLPGRRKQFFQISIPHVISIRAQDDEVIFGFSLFSCSSWE